MYSHLALSFIAQLQIVVLWEHEHKRFDLHNVLAYLRGPAMNWGGLGNHVSTSRTMMAVLYRDLQCKSRTTEPRSMVNSVSLGTVYV